MRLCAGLVGNRIAGQPGRTGVALAAVSDKRQRHARLSTIDDDVGEAVWRRTEIGMQTPDGGRIRRRSAADEVDQRRRARIDRRRRDVQVPPVAEREHLSADQRFVEHRRGRVDDGDCADEGEGGQWCTYGHTHLTITYRAEAGNARNAVWIEGVARNEIFEPK